MVWERTAEWVEAMLIFRSPDSITTYTMFYEAREERHSLFMKEKKLNKSSKDICALQMNKMLYDWTRKDFSARDIVNTLEIEILFMTIALVIIFINNKIIVIVVFMENVKLGLGCFFSLWLPDTQVIICFNSQYSRNMNGG